MRALRYLAAACVGAVIVPVMFMSYTIVTAVNEYEKRRDA